MPTLNPETTAVIVVDMQNGFANPDGTLFAPPSNDAIAPIKQLVEQAQEAGASIVYTRDVHPPDQFDDTHYYDEFDRWGEHVVEGTWDAELIDDLPTEDADLVVEKHTYDAFHETELDGWLTAHNITDVIVVGTLANVCVLHTASSAGLRDYRPLIPEDAVGYLEEADREYALEHADWLFGETTTTANLTFD